MIMSAMPLTARPLRWVTLLQRLAVRSNVKQPLLQATHQHAAVRRRDGLVRPGLGKVKIGFQWFCPGYLTTRTIRQRRCPQQKRRPSGHDLKKLGREPSGMLKPGSAYRQGAIGRKVGVIMESSTIQNQQPVTMVHRDT